MEDCKKYMNLLYCERIAAVDVGYINNIVVSSTARKSTDVVSDVSVKNTSHGSAEVDIVVSSTARESTDVVSDVSVSINVKNASNGKVRCGKNVTFAIN